MDKRPSKVDMLLRIALVVAERATCSRLKVGAVLTDMRCEQLWVGYNGAPRGAANECRREGEGNCGCSHAEANALIRADAGCDKIAAFTHAPCVPCAGLLVNANVREFYYLDEYRDTEGLAVLRESGVRVERRSVGKPPAEYGFIWEELYDPTHRFKPYCLCLPCAKQALIEGPRER